MFVCFFSNNIIGSLFWSCLVNHSYRNFVGRMLNTTSLIIWYSIQILFEFRLSPYWFQPNITIARWFTWTTNYALLTNTADRLTKILFWIATKSSQNDSLALCLASTSLLVGQSFSKEICHLKPFYSFWCFLWFGLIINLPMYVTRIIYICRDIQ